MSKQNQIFAVVAATLVPLLWVCGTQGVRAETIVLDANQVVERAQNTDPRISEKQKLVQVARGMLKEAQGAESWIVDANAFVGFAPSVKGGIFEDANGDLKISKDVLDFNGLSAWYNLEFTVVYPFSTWGKSENYELAAQNNIKIQTAEIDLQRSQTYIDSLTAYYGYLTAQDIIGLLEDSDSKLQSAVDLVEKWLKQGRGKVKQSDLYALQTGSGILHRYLEEAKGMQKIAMAGLHLLTGIPSSDEIQLADSRLKPVDLPPDSLEELQQKALKQRPEMIQVEAGLHARRALVDAKRAEAYPNFYAGVGGSFAYAPNRPRLNELAIYDPFNHYGATPVVGVKWDWWTGRQSGQVIQAEGEYNALLEKKSFAQQGIPFQVAEQYQQVHAHYNMVQQQYKAARAGRRWMLASYADFEAGVEKADRVMNAFQGYILAYSDYLQTVNKFNVYVAKLRVAIGEVK